MTEITQIRRALISVSDKTGIVEFAYALTQAGVEILSTGGTYKLLVDNNIPAVEVSDYTEFPEMMDGRVKTLHPKIHGGILGRRGQDDEVMHEHHINPIDLVVVNLYPFAATVARPDCDLPLAIENIDIGGPTMVRSAAKNNAHVGIVVNASDYDQVLQEINAHQGLTAKLRFDLALKAFEHTAAYDGMIANYLGTIDQTAEVLSVDERDAFPRTFNSQFIKTQDMRYGENPHQKAAFYVEANPAEASIATAKQIQGKELSYNNVADTDAALECVKSFTKPACVIVKHANPCGVAVVPDDEGGIRKAYDLAWATDSESAFGGIIAFNRELDGATAAAIVERQFVEVIIAPRISAEARAAVAAKANVRLLECGEWGTERQADWDYKRVNGGLLVQSRDIGMITAEAGTTRRTDRRSDFRKFIGSLQIGKREPSQHSLSPISVNRGLTPPSLDPPKGLEAAQQLYGELSLPIDFRGFPFLFVAAPIPKRMPRSIGLLLADFKIELSVHRVGKRFHQWRFGTRYSPQWPHPGTRPP